MTGGGVGWQSAAITRRQLVFTKFWNSAEGANNAPNKYWQRIGLGYKPQAHLRHLKRLYHHYIVRQPVNGRLAEALFTPSRSILQFGGKLRQPGHCK
jgi:hypothetical protein